MCINCLKFQDIIIYTIVKVLGFILRGQSFLRKKIVFKEKNIHQRFEVSLYVMSKKSILSEVIIIIFLSIILSISERKDN